MMLHYNSTADIAREYEAKVTHSDRSYLSSDTKWYNNETTKETLQKCYNGDTSLVPMAERLMDKLDTQIETQRRIWEPCVAGAFPCVPDAIMGRPQSMRRIVHVPDEHTPINIFVVTTCSASISSNTMQERGIVILSLVMALSRIRPVSLKQIAFMHGIKDDETIITSDINTAPLDLASACYVLTSAGFARRITYGLARAMNNFNGRWPRAYSWDKEQYLTDLLNKLTPNPKMSLLIREAHSYDAMLHDPIKWVNEQIKRFTQQEEE